MLNVAFTLYRMVSNLIGHQVKKGEGAPLKNSFFFTFLTIILTDIRWSNCTGVPIDTKRWIIYTLFDGDI